MKIVAGYDPPYPNTSLIERILADVKGKESCVYLVTSLFEGHETENAEIDRKEEELQKVKAILDRKGITSETHVLVRPTSPGEEIVRFAEENNVDEIIIQLKKTSRVGKMLTGSNAQHIILNAPCSVVSVR